MSNRKKMINKDRLMILREDFQPPAVVNVNDSEHFLAAHISCDKKTLFWIPAGVQDRTLWALIDTGASRHLISEQEYEAMPHPTTLPPAGDLMVVAGNIQQIPL